MNCKTVQARLSAYLDRELSGDELLRMRAHLAECEECRLEESQLRTLKSMLGEMSAPEPPDDLAERLCAGVLCHRGDARHVWNTRSSFMAFMAITACSMLFTVIALEYSAQHGKVVASGKSAPNVAFEVQRDQAYSSAPDPTLGVPVLSVANYVHP